MHVSSRNMFPTTRNLLIRVRVYRPRHCCGDWLTFGCFVPMIADHDEKINNHGCWGKHAHIPDNEYWGICLFHVVWTIFWGAIILMWYTRNIFLLASDIFFINWTVHKSDNLPKRVQILGHAHTTCITVQEKESSAVKYFAICSQNLPLSGSPMLCSWLQLKLSDTSSENTQSKNSTTFAFHTTLTCTLPMHKN